MRKVALLSTIVICFFNVMHAQLLMNEQFDALANGNLSGQGTWTAINANTISITVANASTITGCTGGGSRYATPGTPSTVFNERVSYPTASFAASTSQVFYLSFLMNLSNAGSDNNAHMVGLGNEFGGTSYEFNRIHARPSGAGYNIGISEGNGTGLGGNSGGGINWGGTVLNLNQTYHIVLRYDYVNGGGVNGDITRLWVNPAITSGSEPAIGSPEVGVGAGALGNDILFDGDIVRNVYLNYRSTTPAYRIDAIRYARGATSAASWSNMGISGTCAALPLTWLVVNAATNSQFQPVLNWKVEERDVNQYVVEKSIDGKDFSFVAAISSKGNGINEYSFTENNSLQGTALYRIKQLDIDGKFNYSSVLLVKNKGGAFISLYPNPVIKQAKLEIPGNRLLNTMAHLYDMNGRLLKKVFINHQITIIDMQNYNSGIFSLILQNGETIKIVKE